MDMNYMALYCLKISKTLYCHCEEKGFVTLMEPP